VHVGVALHLGPGEQVGGDLAGQTVAGRVEPGGRAGAEIDDLGAAGAGGMDQGEAGAAEAAVPGLHRGERERSSDGCVGRIAAGVENGDPGEGGVAGLRDDHTAPAVGGRLAHLPVLGEVGRRSVGHGTGS